MSVNVFYLNISENISFELEDKAAIFADRQDFVHNVGVLASQTREEVKRVYLEKLDNEEYAVIEFKNGYQRKVNIFADSYVAIVLDVFKALQ